MNSLAIIKQADALAKLDAATRMLAEVSDATSAKRVMDVAAAAEEYARRQKLGAEAESHARAIKFDAERKLGEYLKATPKNEGGRPHEKTSNAKAPVSPAPTLADLGISKKLSSEAQRLADLDAEAFSKLRRGETTKSAALGRREATGSKQDEMTPDEQKRKAVKLSDSGVRISDISAALGVHEQTVRRWIADPDTPASTRGHGGGVAPKLNDDDVIRLLDAGKSREEIQEELGVHKSTLTACVKRLGLGKAGARTKNPLIDHISRADVEAGAWKAGVESIMALASISNPAQVQELRAALGRLARVSMDLRTRLKKEVGETGE